MKRHKKVCLIFNQLRVVFDFAFVIKIYIFINRFPFKASGSLFRLFVLAILDFYVR